MSPTAIVAGLLGDGLGLGEAGRGYASALATVGWEVAQHRVHLPGRPATLGDPGPAGVLPHPEVDADADADVVIATLNPPELAALRDERVPLPAGRVRVAFWAWEVDPAPPSWGEWADRLDAVWTPSEYVADLIRPLVACPVEAIAPPITHLGATAPCDLVDDQPTFLALGDTASTLERKNLEGAVEAFTRAFEPDEGPRLLVKVWNGDLDPPGLDALRAAAAGRTDVVVVDRWLPRDQLASLIAGSACLVSLHRAEGLGLPIFEALALGVPVVVSAYSGPMAHLDDTTAFLVPTTPAAVPEGLGPYPGGGTWAEPDGDEAAARLREVWDDPAAASERAERGRQIVARDLSLEAVGRMLDRRLGELLEAADPAVSPRMPQRPPVTVVAHAAEPWPETTGFLDAVVPEAAAVGGEVVLGVADEGVLPDEHRPPGVTTVRTGRRSPFALRAAALDHADGDLVIVTEDHCRPRPGWCKSYEAAVWRERRSLLTGPVNNGSPETPFDWANYLMGFATYAEPLAEPPTGRSPTIANCAVTRGALADHRPPGPVREGWFERTLVPELWRRGDVAVVEEAGVDHVQPNVWWRHVLAHFSDARQAGAFQAREGGDRPSLRPVALARQARASLQQVAHAMGARPELHGPYLADHHRLRLLALARAVGLAVGARWGEGDSAERLD